MNVYFILNGDKEVSFKSVSYLGYLKIIKMYTEEEVSRLLETQRGNCYVAVLNKCGDEEIATACTKAPEPGGDQWKKSKKK